MFLTSFFNKFIEKGYEYEIESSISGSSFAVFNDITGFKIHIPNKIQQVYFRINLNIDYVKAIMDYNNLSAEAQGN